MTTKFSLLLLAALTIATLDAQQFWDGANTTANGTIDGGTGIWNVATTNWTNTAGTANATWAGGLDAVFAGTAGTATIADGFTADPADVDFQTPGYTVTASGSGNLEIAGNTNFTTAAGNTSISAPVTGSGSLTKQGPGTLTLSAANSYTGDTVISTGTLAVSGSINTPSGQIVVGFDPGDNATLNVPTGGSVTGVVVGIAGDTGSTGVARVSGGTLASNGAIVIGSSGNGTLEVTNGGTVTNATGFLGFLEGSVGTARISSGTWTNSDTLTVGNRGMGTLEISGTGQVDSQGAIVGFDQDAIGTVSLSGGSWTLASNLILGFEGEGILEVSGTGSVTNQISFLGVEPGSTGTVQVSGGSWTNSDGLSVGSGGTGRLDLTGGTVRAPVIALAEESGSIGTINVGTGGTAGILSVGEINGGDGMATLNFDHSQSNYAFTTDGTPGGAPITISGTVTVNHSGPGRTILTGTNTYSGGTHLSKGTLSISRDENLGARSTFVTFDGGTLQNTAALATSRFFVLEKRGGTLQADATLRLNAPISGAGGLTKTGAGTLTLSRQSSYTGGTTIDAGTVRTTNSSALGRRAAVTLNDGTLDPVGTLNINSLDYRGGRIATDLGNKTDLVNARGRLSLSDPIRFRFNNTARFDPAAEYLILTARNLARFDAITDFLGNRLQQLVPIFRIAGKRLFVTFTPPPVTSGPLLQNSNPVNVATTADFTVDGRVTTGTPTEDNTINSLRFQPGSSLQIFNTLTVTSGELNALGGTSLITGDLLRTPGDLRKTGPGSLITSNTFDVAGATLVESGGLLVNGTLRSPGGVDVARTALLGGTGLLIGDVTNRGTLSPGNSPGTLSINGDFAQTATGTFDLEVASPAAFDRLLVTGTAALAGTLRTINLGKSFAFGQRIPLLFADRITGDFDRITFADPSRYRGRFLNDSGTGTLLIAPASYTLVAGTQNQRNVARALDSFIDSSDPDRNRVSLALDFLTAEGYPAAFDQISPAFHQSIANIQIQETFTRTQLVNQRLSSARLGARGFQLMGLDEEPLTFDKDGKAFADPKDPAANTPTDWTAWAMGSGIFARVTSVNQVPNHRFDSGGFLIGADYDWNGSERDGLTTGVFAGYQGTTADYDGGGSTVINSALFGTYASCTHEGYYADGVISGGFSSARVRRAIEFSTVDRLARSDQETGQASAALNLGKDWTIGNFTFGPIAGAQYTYLGIAPFTETNADSLDLRVDQQDVHSLRSTLGGRVAYSIDLTTNIRLIPEIRLLWQHEFLNNSRNIGSALDAGSGPSFDTATADPGRDGVFAGAGVTAQLGDRWNTSVYYNADFGRQDLTSHTVSASLGIQF